ncbi:MAG: efflux RND transporter periplasmic adaptor subunit, partial [Bacteroidales bacterium]
MKVKDILSNTYLKAGLLVLAGLFLGWLIFHQSETTVKTNQEAVHEHAESEHQIWTCAMHPQIRMDEPGDCPICGMELIPLQSSNVEIDDQAIEMSASAMKLAEIQTSVVTKGAVTKEVLLYGKIRVDERLKQSQAAHVPGRIEKLMINVTGEQIRSGQLIASIYSPELVTAQKELLEAMSLKDKYPSLVEAAREKLRNWKLTEDQIKEIEMSGQVTSNFNIYANTSGIVVDIRVSEGDHIAIGTVLFDVTDFSKVWGIFDAYESDLSWISLSQKVDFTAEAIPGQSFSGTVSFIDPVIDPATRTARVRIELNNPKLLLKPGMFINGVIHSTIKGNGDQLIIPQSAVLWTGTRSVVYVKIPDTEHPSFKMREITLGPATKNSYVVMKGLSEDEEIVTNGTFSVDAAAQLAGKTSMMNPEGEQISSGGMAGMDMGSGNKTSDAKEKSSTKNMHQPSKTETIQGDLPKAFKSDMEHFVNAYLDLKNAFVESDENKVDQMSQKALTTLNSIELNGMNEIAQKQWIEYKKPIVENLTGIIEMEGIDMKRKHFSTVSNILYKMLETFGNTAHENLYLQYCPMAFDNTGAFWISNETAIRNPYFGDMMLKCGE